MVHQRRPGQGQQFAAVQRLPRQGQGLGHELARQAVAARDMAVGIQGQQALAFLAQRAAGPVQVQQQRMGLGAQQPVLDGACAAQAQVQQFGAFRHVDARDVQHAQAAPIRAEKGTPAQL